MINQRQRRASDTDDCDGYRQRSSNWRLLKEISIPTLVALAAQSAAGIWWAATMNNKVESLEKALLHKETAQAVTDARQDSEMARAESRISVQIERMGIKLDRIYERGKAE